MTIAEISEGIQFTVDANGRTTAVVLTPEVWQQLLDALEAAEDRALVEALRARLAQAPGKAGALRWQEVSGDWRGPAPGP